MYFVYSNGSNLMTGERRRRKTKKKEEEEERRKNMDCRIKGLRARTPKV